jgi:hypothetical protein
MLVIHRGFYLSSYILPRAPPPKTALGTILKTNHKVRIGYDFEERIVAYFNVVRTADLLDTGKLKTASNWTHGCGHKNKERKRTELYTSYWGRTANTALSLLDRSGCVR